MTALPTTAPALPPVAADVSAFARQQGIATYLPGVLELTQRLFPEAQISVYIEADPDARDEQTLIVEVDASGLETAQMIATRRQWVGDIFNYCPATHVCLFSLRMV
jgi:hypothetical protein